MPEFLRLSSPVESLRSLLTALPDRKPDTEILETQLALGRILGVDIYAPHPLPEFSRSSVDGYAVLASNTYGVSDILPGYLTLIGEVPMGESPCFILKPGECALIHTGGMLPEGANAVCMLEDTQLVQHSQVSGREGQLKLADTDGLTVKKEIEIFRTVAVGENVIQLGEDVTAGQLVIAAGVRIRPAEIGGCTAFGINKIRVAIKPRVGIISSGNEVIPPDHNPSLGQVRDINSYSLAGLVEQVGGKPSLYGIVQDNLDALKSTAKKALRECDVVLVTAGSSASARDMTAEAIASLGEPGVLVHGINVRPGKPTILAVCDGKAVIGLPGNPVSALVIAGLFVKPVVEKLLGLRVPYPYPSLLAKLRSNVASQAGREDWVAVKLRQNELPSLEKTIPGFHLVDAGWQAEPVFGKSNLIFSLVAADGLMRIPPDVNGFSAGEIVEVILIV